jgi:hypothetical protein
MHCHDDKQHTWHGQILFETYWLVIITLQLCSHCQYNHTGHYFRLADMGQEVGVKVIDLLFVRERNCKREIKLLNMLLFIKSTLWKVSCGHCLHQIV